MLTTHQAAEYLHVTPRTVLRWVDAGVLPAHSTGGGRRRIKPDDLQQFMRSRGMDVPSFSGGERLRVAIIDDDALHVRGLERALRAIAPAIELETAADGFAAGALLYTFRPHLLLLDLVMPGMDGFEVCRRVRAEPLFSGLGVVVQSSHVTPVVHVRLRELGVDHVLSKPVRRAELEPVLQRFVPDAMAVGGRRAAGAAAAG